MTMKLEDIENVSYGDKILVRDKPYWVVRQEKDRWGNPNGLGLLNTENERQMLGWYDGYWSWDDDSMVIDKVNEDEVIHTDESDRERVNAYLNSLY